MRFLITAAVALLFTQTVTAVDSHEERLSSRQSSQSEVASQSTATAVPTGKANQLVVYSASWCAACQRLNPVIESLKQDGYKVVYLSVDKDADKIRYPYRAIPTIYFLNGDDVIKKEVGYRSKQQIQKTLILESKPIPVRTVSHWN